MGLNEWDGLVERILFRFELGKGEDVGSGRIGIRRGPRCVADEETCLEGLPL